MNGDYLFFLNLKALADWYRKNQRAELAMQLALARNDMPDFPNWVSDRSFYRFLNGLNLAAYKAEGYDRADCENTRKRFDYANRRVASQVIDDIHYWTSGAALIVEFRDDDDIDARY